MDGLPDRPREEDSGEAATDRPFDGREGVVFVATRAEYEEWLKRNFPWVYEELERARDALLEAKSAMEEAEVGDTDDLPF